jgi:aspartyl-tRNA(Asn)/glutamyl-tRNA(Gln) amidotransferase subunit C
MTDELTENQIRQVAKLARLNINDDEIASLTRELGAILVYVAQLDELDTSSVEPLAHSLPVHNIMRQDELRPSLSNDDALANAPQSDGEFFAIPKVLGDSDA